MRYDRDMTKREPKGESGAEARRQALKRGGAAVVTHRKPRAPRSDGPRTTLRVPDSLVISAERLAGELGISRNDALLRLATRGADLYETERLIEKRREERWKAVVPGEIEPGVSFPEAEEIAEAVRPGL